ncbi:SET domain-containing protein, partial [Acephala macrosclerotiorum]
PVRYPETLGTLVQICEVEGKGLGMIAAKDIPPGTFLLVETPIFVLLKSQTDTAIEAAVDALSPETKRKYFELSAYMGEEGESLKARIMDCNAFSIMDETASGVFETASRINHSCVPNSQYGWRESIGRLVVWNRFKLLEGEEVTIDYGHGKKSLRENYGFECTCGGCTDGE